MKRLGLCLALVFASCATSRINDTWVNPSAVARKPEKTLVIAFMPNEVARQTAERTLTQELVNRGVNAIPASAVLPDLQRADQVQVRELAEQQGFDTVVVEHFRGTETQTRYVPGTYYGFFSWRDPWLYDPGYLETQRVAFIETSAYDVKSGGQLLWTALSESTDPSRSSRALSSVASQVAKRMAQEGVI